MAYVAFIDRYNLNLMTFRVPHRPRPADRQLVIVGVCAEGDDAQLAVAGLRAGGGLFKVDRESDGERRQERQRDATESEQGSPLHFVSPPKECSQVRFDSLCYAMQRGVICWNCLVMISNESRHD